MPFQATAMVIHQASSGLAEDRFVNTFHFNGTADYLPSAVTIAGRLIQFFSGGGPAGSLGEYMSAWIDREESEVRVYDMADAKPRVPYVQPFVLTPGDTPFLDLPQEVALCASFKGVAPNTARRRGRVYLGPFTSKALEEGQPPPARPSSGLVSAAVAAMNQLANSSTSAIEWVVHSPTANLDVPITNGWVDNAFDTMRKRGPDPTSRVTWTRV